MVSHDGRHASVEIASNVSISLDLPRKVRHSSRPSRVTHAQCVICSRDAHRNRCRACKVSLCCRPCMREHWRNCGNRELWSEWVRDEHADFSIQPHDLPKLWKSWREYRLACVHGRQARTSE